MEKFPQPEGKEAKIEKLLPEILQRVEQDRADFERGGYLPEATPDYLKEQGLSPNEVARHLFEKSKEKQGLETIAAVDVLEDFIWAAEVDPKVERELDNEAMEDGLERLIKVSDKLGMSEEKNFLRNILEKRKEK